MIGPVEELRSFVGVGAPAPAVLMMLGTVVFVVGVVVLLALVPVEPVLSSLSPLLLVPLIFESPVPLVWFPSPELTKRIGRLGWGLDSRGLLLGLDLVMRFTAPEEFAWIEPGHEYHKAGVFGFGFRPLDLRYISTIPETFNKVWRYIDHTLMTSLYNLVRELYRSSSLLTSHTPTKSNSHSKNVSTL